MTKQPFAQTSITHRLGSACILLLLILAATAVECTRPIREDAVKVVEAGSTTAKQMSEYYNFLSQEVIKTWELNAFSEGYATSQIASKFDKDIQSIDEQIKVEKQENILTRLKADKLKQEQQRASIFSPTPLLPEKKTEWEKEVQEISKKLQNEKAKSEPERSDGAIRTLEASLKNKQALLQSGSGQAAIKLLYQQRYEALLVRKQMASELRSVYEQFARLANYNAAQDVQTKVNDLSTSLSKVLDTPLPELSPTSNSLVGKLLGDVIKQVFVAKQNMSIRVASQQVIPALRQLISFFDQEKNVYKSIVTSHTSFNTQIAKNLVDNSTVISTALINDVLAAYELKWAEPQSAFTSKPMIEGIKGIIDARAIPLQQASQSTVDNLYISLIHLVKLHEQLDNKKPLTFSEFAETSATVQLLLNQLNAKGIPSADVIDLLKLLSK